VQVCMRAAPPSDVSGTGGGGGGFWRGFEKTCNESQVIPPASIGHTRAVRSRVGVRTGLGYKGEKEAPLGRLGGPAVRGPSRAKRSSFSKSPFQRGWVSPASS
jgi:hypothetical protein